MKSYRIGVIGHRFMGKAHSHAFYNVNRFFPLQHTLLLDTLCGIGHDLPEKAAQYGFLHHDTDWRAVVSNPQIDIIDICTPDNLHKEIAVEAARHGKHILCEKPLSIHMVDAKAMLDAARMARVVHLCNFVYRAVPVIRLAKDLIAEGKLGKVHTFRASYQQDFCASPDAPFQWRMDGAVAGPGIIGDKGAHIIDLARYLVGDIQAVQAIERTVIPLRRAEDGTMRKVESPDVALFTVSFLNGGIGTFEVSNVAWGSKNALRFEANGTLGSLRFNLERLNELEVYCGDDKPPLQGFRTIHVTGSGYPYGEYWWPDGHALGWEHAFTHQVHEFISAIEESRDASPSFEDGYRCQQVIDAVAAAARTRGTVSINADAPEAARL